VEAEATVLFCDLEGFTPLTESLGPVGVVAFLNAYFEVMVGIVERHGGLMTQYQGDAILAVFNVPVELPGHAAAALRAGMEMVRATEAQQFAGISVRNRVGISTGPLVAGSIGARGRLAYTVHGNVVNLASRLEVLNKDYGTRILVAGETARRCQDIALRKVAEVAVRGYSEPVSLFTLPEDGRGPMFPIGNISP
jgi:class 3 adenylate cyclase